MPKKPLYPFVADPLGKGRRVACLSPLVRWSKHQPMILMMLERPNKAARALSGAGSIWIGIVTFLLCALFGVLVMSPRFQRWSYFSYPIFFSLLPYLSSRAKPLRRQSLHNIHRELFAAGFRFKDLHVLRTARLAFRTEKRIRWGTGFSSATVATVYVGVTIFIYRQTPFHPLQFVLIGWETVAILIITASLAPAIIITSAIGGKLPISLRELQQLYGHRRTFSEQVEEFLLALVKVFAILLIVAPVLVVVGFVASLLSAEAIRYVWSVAVFACAFLSASCSHSISRGAKLWELRSIREKLSEAEKKWCEMNERDAETAAA